MAAFPVWLSDPKYNLLRATTPSIIIRDNARNISINDYVIEYNDFRYGNYRVRIVLKQKFWVWSSNYYTLDWIWNFPAFKLWIAGVEIPLFGIFMWADIKEGTFGLHLYVSLFTPSSERHAVALPAAPSGYWLPTVG